MKSSNVVPPDAVTFPEILGLIRKRFLFFILIFLPVFLGVFFKIKAQYDFYRLSQNFIAKSDKQIATPYAELLNWREMGRDYNILKRLGEAFPEKKLSLGDLKRITTIKIMNIGNDFDHSSQPLSQYQMAISVQDHDFYAAKKMIDIWTQSLIEENRKRNISMNKEAADLKKKAQEILEVIPKTNASMLPDKTVLPDFKKNLQMANAEGDFLVKGFEDFKVNASQLNRLSKDDVNKLASLVFDFQKRLSYIHDLLERFDKTLETQAVEWNERGSQLYDRAIVIFPVGEVETLLKPSDGIQPALWVALGVAFMASLLGVCVVEMIRKSSPIFSAREL